jgi:surface antigen
MNASVVVKAVAALFFVVCAAGAAQAAGRSFADSLPWSRMTDEDRTIAMGTINRALDEGAPGTTYRWDNPATKASGSITPKKTFTHAGMTCRDVEIHASADGRQNTSRWKMCKTAEGWKALE